MPLPDGLDADAVEGVFVDLDGTVVHHAELLPTAIEAVAALQATGVPVVVGDDLLLALEADRESLARCRPGDLLSGRPRWQPLDG